MSNATMGRRELLRTIALAAVAASVPEADAQHVHHEMAAETAKTGTFQPQALTAHQFATLRALADRIIPPDETSPGGAEAGTAEFVDILARHSTRMTQIYADGLAWMDAQIKAAGGTDFLSATAAQQSALLDRIAFRRNRTPDLAPGIEFFAFLRRMTVDAYFTSPAGIRYLGFVGNKGSSKFEVPKEALEYALRRAPDSL